MAGLDPRRSSRARTTQSQSQISSTTSSASGRAERSSRHFNKGGSPQKSTSTGSLSSEPPEDTITADDPFTTQRHTRRQGKERDRTAAKLEPVEMAKSDDDVQDEDEAVRCICGFDEYPGPPQLDEDSKNGLKDNDMDPIFATDVTDDAAGFFVQCDICKVWQHGACVGIMTEESSPDEYFCEECRKDFHKINTASNGQRFSFYIPLKRNSRTGSRAASINKDGTRSPPKEKETRSGRSAASQAASKRRSTMNSREAAYDEAEALRRAIEASKEEALGDGVQPLTRRAKRGRSDSEEKLESAKRQKTSSRSSSPSYDQAGDESDDAGTTTRNGASKSRGRNTLTTRNQAEKPSEREERERQRVEAANKRKGRAERRRADDSDPSEELPLAARVATNKTAAATAATATNSTTTTTATEAPPHQLSITDSAPISNQPSPDTPPASAVPTKIDKKRSHKKKGRNQHTRDGHDEDSPARSQSRDIQKDEHAPSGGGSKASEITTSSKAHAKSKGGMSSKITMTDMKRRAAALLDFISRTQVELAAETLVDDTRAAAADISKADNNNNNPNGSGTGASAPSTTTSDSKNQPDPGSDASPTAEAAAENTGAPPHPGKEFKELNCIEMMDSLTRRLVKWQQEYAP